jgi:hypothetical protein
MAAGAGVHNPNGGIMPTLRIATQKLSRIVAAAALAATLTSLGAGPLVAPALAGEGVPPEWELEQKPGGNVGEFLKQKPANPAGTEKRDPCAPPREPWTECRDRRLYQCTQTLSPVGAAICNYHERCTNTGRRC